MSTELVRTEPQAVAVHEDASIMSVIARAAADPMVDVAKMRELLDLQERFTTKTAEVDFKASMNRLQPRLPQIDKHGAIVVNGQTRSKYARYEDIDAACRQLYTAEGFSHSFDTRTAEGKTTYYIRVDHRAGHSETKELQLPDDTSGSKNSIQAHISTVSYAKRCLMKMAYNIIEAGEDNDGNGVSYISEDDACRIEDMLVALGDTSASKTNERGFLKFMGAPTVREIQQRDLARGIQALRDKMQKAGR